MKASITTTVSTILPTATSPLRVGSVSCQFISRLEFFEAISRMLRSERPHHILTLNPEMVVRAEYDEQFRQAVAQAAMVIPDGAGLFWARDYLGSHRSFWVSLIRFVFIPAERLTGVESVSEIARLATAGNQSLYLLGGTPRQAAGTAEALRERYPGLSVFVGPAHGFDPAGPKNVLEDINHKKPTVLFVAYGAPHQAIWIERWLSFLPSVRVAMGVGGAFALLSGEIPRAPAWLRRMNGEWVWRLAQEPARWPRIVRAVITFPRLIWAQKRTVLHT